MHQTPTAHLTFKNDVQVQTKKMKDMRDKGKARSYPFWSFRMLVAERYRSRLSLSPIFHSRRKASMRLNDGTIRSVTLPMIASFTALLKIRNRPYGFPSILYRWNRL